MSEDWVDLMALGAEWSDRTRTLQVFQCFLCGAYTNLIEPYPMPNCVCPHRAKAWHDEIKTIWQSLCDPALPAEERRARIVAINGILAVHAHPDDVEGRADRLRLYHFGLYPDPCKGSENGCVYFHFGFYPAFSRERKWYIPEDPQP